MKTGGRETGFRPDHVPFHGKGPSPLLGIESARSHAIPIMLCAMNRMRQSIDVVRSQTECVGLVSGIVWMTHSNPNRRYRPSTPSSARSARPPRRVQARRRGHSYMQSWQPNHRLLPRSFYLGPSLPKLRSRFSQSVYESDRSSCDQPLTTPLMDVKLVEELERRRNPLMRKRSRSRNH